MIGEARFLRGFSYFILWQLYGGVIILDKPTQPSETYLPRNTADEVRDFVIEDFKDAIERLPLEYNDSENGRITKGAAVAMLGRTYLYDKRWKDAADELHKLMEEPYKYDLVEDYTKLFDWKYEKMERLMIVGMAIVHAILMVNLIVLDHIFLLKRVHTPMVVLLI